MRGVGGGVVGSREGCEMRGREGKGTEGTVERLEMGAGLVDQG